MRACWAVKLLVLVQPSPASYATCRGTSVVPRVLAPTHRHLRKSPSVRQPFAEISGSISFSPRVFPFPETVPNFVCHFKGSLHSSIRRVLTRAPLHDLVAVRLEQCSSFPTRTRDRVRLLVQRASLVKSPACRHPTLNGVKNDAAALASL